MWQVTSVQTGQAVKFLKWFIPMMNSGSHVCISKIVKVSSLGTIKYDPFLHKSLHNLKLLTANVVTGLHSSWECAIYIHNTKMLYQCTRLLSSSCKIILFGLIFIDTMGHGSNHGSYVTTIFDGIYQLLMPGFEKDFAITIRIISIRCISMIHICNGKYPLEDGKALLNIPIY